jgi:phosphoglycerate dehydrogenase-like enzyme
MKPLVAVTETLSPAAMTWLRSKCEVVQASPGNATFVSHAPRVQGLVVRTLTQVDHALVRSLPALKVVGRAGVGLDNIDLQACRERDVTVVSTPDANTQAVVEYVLSLLCDAMRPRVFLDKPVDAEAWERIRSEICGVKQMDECTLGILGLGRIGSRVAQVASAIGFEVLYNDLRAIPVEQRHGATPVSIERLFAESDVLTLHIDGRPSNRHAVNASLIASMKSDALLLNTCRGFVLDHEALRDFLAGNRGAQALLDVHEPEPFGADHPLLELPNAHLAPHLASRTRTAMERMSWVVRDVVAVLHDQSPQFPA